MYTSMPKSNPNRLASESVIVLFAMLVYVYTQSCNNSAAVRPQYLAANQIRLEAVLNDYCCTRKRGGVHCRGNCSSRLSTAQRNDPSPASTYISSFHYDNIKIIHTHSHTYIYIYTVDSGIYLYTQCTLLYDIIYL